jgi:hypothetical protein
MTKTKSTKEAPNRLPTKTSGVLLIIEFIPTLNSGIEVSIPKTKKETAKEEIFNRWEKRSTEWIIIPEQYQRMKKEMR